MQLVYAEAHAELGGVGRNVIIAVPEGHAGLERQSRTLGCALYARVCGGQAVGRLVEALVCVFEHVGLGRAYGLICLVEGHARLVEDGVAPEEGQHAVGIAQIEVCLALVLGDVGLGDSHGTGIVHLAQQSQGAGYTLVEVLPAVGHGAVLGSHGAVLHGLSIVAPRHVVTPRLVEYGEEVRAVEVVQRHLDLGLRGVPRLARALRERSQIKIDTRREQCGRCDACCQ